MSEPTTNDLPAVIETAISESSSKVHGKSITMVAEYPAHLPAIEEDRQPLVQAIECLLDQAVEWIDGGEIKLKVEVLGSGETFVSGGKIIDPPEDLGESGPLAVLRVVFQCPQERTLEDLAPLDGLTGVWSSGACREAMLAFQGRLWLELDKGEGLCAFGLALPLWAVHDVSTDVSSLRRAVDTRLPETGPDHPTLILMVEDEGLRDLLAKDLQTAGYEVITAGGGEAVLQLARSESPDLILLDLLARDPTAFEVAALLKHDVRTRNLPVLFLTSMSDPAGGISMGAVSYVARQADTGALISAVNAVLTAGLQPNARVLVVEADSRLREHMVMTIQSQGFRVSEARAPEEALALAERAVPGMALVNARLAQERDYWLLRGLRQTAPEAEIYVMAEMMSPEDVDAALRRGASGFSETGKLPDLLDQVRRGRDQET